MQVIQQIKAFLWLQTAPRKEYVACIYCKVMFMYGFLNIDGVAPGWAKTANFETIILQLAQ